ncbi:hypothetical protein Patl1_34701 [Pistacia atlantica]|uniref:Uncharacterized protein n=1 Tax=Pistacia atlantica TaxID=434234 RepID=A0ACC0ZRC9_9ROSI|nr:hypothetical protein Patl1_34701 [Pistacia atlantica]
MLASSNSGCPFSSHSVLLVPAGSRSSPVLYPQALTTAGSHTWMSSVLCP